MSETAIYHRTGWKSVSLIVAGQDSETDLIDLANEDGEIIVRGVPVIDDPAEEENLPSAYATMVVEGNDQPFDNEVVDFLQAATSSDRANVTEENLSNFKKPQLLQIAEAFGADEKLTSKSTVDDVVAAILKSSSDEEE